MRLPFRINPRAEIRFLVFFVILIALATIATAQEPIPNNDANNFPFDTVRHGQSSGITQEWFELIRDVDVWTEFWNSHARAGFDTRNGPVGDPVPIIDFQKESVIVVHLGTRSSLCYRVYITKIENQAEKLTVYYDETKPAPGRACAMAITHPFHIVKIAKTENEPLFIRNGPDTKVP